METLTSCPVCGGGDFIPFAVERDEKDEFSRLILPGQTLGSCLCKACSFLFQNPRLPRNPVEAYYGQSMYRKRDGAITIEEGYKSYAVMQLTRYYVWLLSCGLDLNQIRGATCLDYGCGIGGALDFLSKQGNRVFGVEIDRTLADFGNANYGITIVNTLEELPPGQVYNFIFSHHSLEHVYDPNDFGKFVATSLAPDGVLVVVVPTWRYGNSGQALQQISASHYSGFDHVSLSRLLNKHGLFMTAHNYQNTVPDSPEWEICAVAIKSPRMNYFVSQPESDLLELQRNVPIRAQEKSIATRMVVEKVTVLHEPLSNVRPAPPQPALPAAQSDVQINRLGLDTTFLYLLAKLVAAPRAQAEALLAHISIDSVAAAIPSNARPTVDMPSVLIHLETAKRLMAEGEFGPAIRALQSALVAFAGLVEAGRQNEAIQVVHQALGQLAAHAPWSLHHLLELAGGGASYLETGRPTASAHETKLFLGGTTNAKANDFFNWAAASIRPPQPIDPAGGVLGLSRPGALESAVRDIEENGYHLFDQRLSGDVVKRLYDFAVSQPCHPHIADGAVDAGRLVAVDLASTTHDGFHMPTDAALTSPDVQRLLVDPSFVSIAQGYFGCQPVFTSANIWWSLPSNRRPNSNLAQQFHYDMEWWRWLKFFVYLTDVDDAGGPHVYVRKSHRSGSKPNALLQRGYVRIPDEDIRRHYGDEDIVTVTGPAGTVLVGDTRCWHKGAHPTAKPRLLLQFEWASTLAHGAPTPPITLPATHDPELGALIRQHPYRFQRLVS